MLHCIEIENEKQVYIYILGVCCSNMFKHKLINFHKYGRKVSKKVLGRNTIVESSINWFWGMQVSKYLSKLSIV